MIEIHRARLFRQTLLGALYFAQGVPWGFVSIALPIYLAGRVDQATISGVLATAYLPWSFKWIAGPVIDRFTLRRFGRRRPWILGAELAMAASLLALTGVDPATSWPLFMGLVFAHNCFAALQDVATDALAVDVLDERERGTANSVMFGCKYAGVAAGGAPLSWLGRTAGFEAVFVAMALVLLGIAGLVLLAREGTGGPVAGPGDAAVPAPAPESSFTWAELLRSFATTSTLLAVPFAVLAQLGGGLTGSLFIPLLKEDLGWAAADVEIASGGLAVVAATLGAFAGGVVSDLLGRRRTIVLASAVACALYAALGLIPAVHATTGAVHAYVVAVSVAEGLLSTALLATFMDLSNPRVGGTQFTAYMSLLNVGNTLSAWAGGQLAMSMGRLAVFPIAAAAQGLALVLLVGILPHETSERFRKEGD